VHCKGKTYSFGAGRDAFARTNTKSPGPGEYKPLKPIGTDALKFSIKSRLEYGDPAIMARKKNIPGVGHYPDTLATN